MTHPLQNQNKYETIDLKLSALILSSIPGSNAEVYQEGNTLKKTIRISYLNQHQKEVENLINDFINRKAKVDMFLYNKALNVLRDKIRLVQS